MDKIRVLLIDDHPVVRAGVGMRLEQHADLEVVGQAHSGQLVEFLKPDVLRLDMEVPSKNRVEVAQEVNKNKKNVWILGLSAYDDEE